MQKQCKSCSRDYAAKRDTSQYCSDRCRKRAQRSPANAPTVLAVVDLDSMRERGETFRPAGDQGADDATGYGVGMLEAATRRQVEEAGRLDTALGVAAVIAARRLDVIGEGETGSGVKALLDAHRAALAAAVANAAQEDNPLAKIRAAAALKMVAGA